MAKQNLGSTSLSVQGDRKYVNDLKALAARRGISLAELTRLAMDTVYGEELKALAIFFDNTVAYKQHMLSEENKVHS